MSSGRLRDGVRAALPLALILFGDLFSVLAVDAGMGGGRRRDVGDDLRRLAAASVGRRSG